VSDIELSIGSSSAPIHLHSLVLRLSSGLFDSWIQLKNSTQRSGGAITHSMTWEYDEFCSDPIYCGVLVKCLRLCYGEGQTFTADEGIPCLVVGHQLQLTTNINTNGEIERLIEDAASRDIYTCVKMLEDCVVTYKDFPQVFGGIQQTLLDILRGECWIEKSIVNSVRNMANMPAFFPRNFYIVSNCLSKLPQSFLDDVRFDDPHIEFELLYRYVSHNSNLDSNQKYGIIKKCDLTQLSSDELLKLDGLQIVDHDEMIDLYHNAFRLAEEKISLLWIKYGDEISALLRIL